MADEGDTWEIRTAPRTSWRSLRPIRAAGLEPERAELTMIPSTTAPVADEDAPKLFRLLDDLNDHDDVQQVFANFEVSDEFLEKLAA